MCQICTRKIPHDLHLFPKYMWEVSEPVLALLCCREANTVSIFNCLSAAWSATRWIHSFLQSPSKHPMRSLEMCAPFRCWGPCGEPRTQWSLCARIWAWLIITVFEKNPRLTNVSEKEAVGSLRRLGRSCFFLAHVVEYHLHRKGNYYHSSEEIIQKKCMQIDSE